MVMVLGGWYGGETNSVPLRQAPITTVVARTVNRTRGRKASRITRTIPFTASEILSKSTARRLGRCAFGTLLATVRPWPGATMPNYWLVKTEPSTYSYDDLARAATAVWDGVKNPVALRNLRAMHPGDQVLVYHTGDEKAVVGWATVVSAPYADPKKKDPKLVVIDLKAHRRLPQAVTLAQIKADKTFADLPIVRQGRLSVSPVTAPQWKRVMHLGGADD